VIGAVDRDENTARDYDIAGGRKLVTLKLVGYTEVIHALTARLTDDSSIVLFGGLAMMRPYPGSTTVTTVNGAVSSMIRTLALELAPIRINALHPAIVGDTPFWENKPPEVLDALRGRTPIGRLVSTADVVHATAFLLENEAINGINLVYVKAQDIADRRELYYVDITNPGAATRLNPAMVAGGNVEGIPFFTTAGGNVIYYADQETDDLRTLYAVSVLTPGMAVTLAEGPIREAEVGVEGNRFFIPRISASADNSVISFLKRNPDSLHFEAFVVSVANANPRKVSINTPDTGTLLQTAVSPRGRYVAYVAASITQNLFEVFMRDLESDEDPVPLSNPMEGSVLTLHGFVD
jgi:hypothetical protein